MGASLPLALLGTDGRCPSYVVIRGRSGEWPKSTHLRHSLATSDFRKADTRPTWVAAIDSTRSSPWYDLTWCRLILARRFRLTCGKKGIAVKRRGVTTAT